jgi:hypothetical protein
VHCMCLEKTSGGREKRVCEISCLWITFLDDLRLQFSRSSSIYFSIPYGLPGDPNLRRQGRIAIETRVHNVWV